MAESQACPKRMEYGPCGGVRADLTCEMLPIGCPFSVPGADVVRWAGRPRDPGLDLGAALERPVVLTDLSVRPYDARHLAEVVTSLAGSCDALLVGEHQNRPDFPPAIMTRLIADAGGTPWITLSCRDRNRVVLEQELAGLALAGVAAVLCVTGDGRAQGVRPEVTQVFDLDGTRLAALARDAGLTVAVPEAPEAPPVQLRAARLREKQRAGAQVCVLNHVHSPARVTAFAEAARAVGVTLPMIAGVAVYTDERSAAVLQRFPGFNLDPARVERVLQASDPVAAGIGAALEEARELLAVDGIVGVNLSGLASDRGAVFAAGVKATIGHEIARLRP